MKRLIPLLFLLSALSWGQSTTVTLQVTDSGGQAWNNGSWSLQLVSQPGTSNPGPPFFILGTATPVANQTLSGTLSATGGASLSLVPNASISPAQSTWRFVVCPNATIDCYRQSVIIAGASQNVNLTPPNIQISGQNGLPPNTLAYTDSEVVSPAQGAQYFNVTSLSQRQWNGSAWINMGGSINLSCGTIGAIVRQSAIGPIFLCDPNATLDGNGLLSATGINVNGAGTGTVTVQTGTAPSNPSSGNATLYVNSSTGFLSCLNSSGGSCNPTTGSLAFSAITSGANTVAVMQNSTGSSLAPINVGQVAGSQAWLTAGISAPVVTGGATSSGTLQNTHGEAVEITYNTTAGETLPSLWVNTAANAAGCASNCSVIVTAPSLPTGFTGYSVYACDISSGTFPATPCGSPATLVRLASCTNITTNCVISAVPSGATQPPTINTAWVQPPNVQASNALLGVIPSWFFPKTDGNYYPWLGVEWTSCDAVNGPSGPCGTPVFTHRTYFNDDANAFSSATTPGKNAFVAIDHQSGVGTVLTNQDRALWVNHSNLPSDTSGHYSITGIQAETDVRGAPGAWNAAVDSEVADISAQLEDDTTNNPSLPNGGVSVIRSSYFARPTGNGLTQAIGVRSHMSNARISGSWPGGTNFIGLDTGWDGASAINGNVQGIGLKIDYPATAAKFGALNVGIEIPGVAMSITSSDWLIDNLLAGLPSNLNGTVATTGLVNSGVPSGSPGTYVISGAVSVPSSITTTQSVAPNQAAGASCTGGASQYAYQLVGVDNNSGQVLGTALTTPTTCVNPLTGVNPATLSISTTILTPAIAAQFIRIDVYRTAGPMATGKIGSLICSSTSRSLGPACAPLVDTGLTASGSIPVAVNTTGSIAAAGPVVSTPSGPVSGSWNCVNVTPVTVNTNTAADQNMMACTIPANTLNSLNKTLRVYAAGVYSTPAASTSQMTMKAKLCTVSGCGSGTVITPINIQSTALGTVQITNDNFSLHSDISTQTTGASSAYEAHGEFLIDLATLTTAADSSFGDTNTATVGTIDATVQLFLQITFAFSNASGSNSATQRQLIVDSVN